MTCTCCHSHRPRGSHDPVLFPKSFKIGVVGLERTLGPLQLRRYRCHSLAVADWVRP